MSLYDEFLAFEATECPWLQYKFSEVLNMDLTMFEVRYVMNLTSCLTFLRDVRESLSKDRNNVNVYRQGFVHIYNIYHILLKLDIETPKISFPPDIQEYLNVHLIMNS